MAADASHLHTCSGARRVCTQAASPWRRGHAATFSTPVQAERARLFAHPGKRPPKLAESNEGASVRRGQTGNVPHCLAGMVVQCRCLLVPPLHSRSGCISVGTKVIPIQRIPMRLLTVGSATHGSRAWALAPCVVIYTGHPGCKMLLSQSGTILHRHCTGAMDCARCRAPMLSSRGPGL